MFYLFLTNFLVEIKKIPLGWGHNILNLMPKLVKSTKLRGYEAFKLEKSIKFTRYGVGIHKTSYNNLTIDLNITHDILRMH